MRQKIAELSDRLLGKVMPTSRASACYWSAYCTCDGYTMFRRRCCYDSQGNLHCGCVDYSDC